MPARSRRRSTLLGAVTAAVVATLVLGGAAGAAPTADPSATADDGAVAPGQRYVALGDSYTSAPFTGPPAGGPLGCLRSNNNFPHVLAAGIDAELTDVSCGGATTEDFASPQRVSDGANPPQFDALGADTELVTVGIGGNDIGFGEIVTRCISKVPFGTPCRDRFTAGGTDELAARIDELEGTLVDVLDEVGRRAPDARVLIVGYPSILPDQGPGCYPVVPYTPGDVAYLRGVLLDLNATIADAAGTAGVTYVDTYGPTIGHDVCTPPGTRWIEGLLPTAPAAPVHPNAQGSAAIARAVAATLEGTASA